MRKPWLYANRELHVSVLQLSLSLSKTTHAVLVVDTLSTRSSSSHDIVTGCIRFRNTNEVIRVRGIEKGTG
jgi:hypothetical protein